jgi:hypothetical protein
MTSAEVTWTFIPGPGEGKTKWFIITAIDQADQSESQQIIKSAHGYEIQRTIFRLKTNHIYVFKIQAINDVGYGPPTYSDPITINTNWIPTNLNKIQFWFDASALDFEDNQPIQTWEDITNLTRLELAGSPPNLIKNGLNGLSIANFTPEQGYRITKHLTNVNQSFFAVVRQTGGTSETVFTSYTSNQYVGYFNGQKQVIYLDALPSLRQNQTSDANWDLISLTLEQKSSSIFLWNGYPIKSSQLTNPITSLTFNMGSDCQIAEVIFYNDTLITEDRQVVEGYLAWKWGLQNNLPSTHPYKGTKPPINYTNKVPPKVPTNIIQVDGNQTSIEIIWTPPLYALSYAFTLNNIEAIPSKLLISTVVFNDLTIGTNYNFVITAVNTFGSSSAQPILTYTAPNHPHNLSSSAIAVKGFTVIWVGGARATSYQYLIDGNPTTPLDDQGVTNKKVTFTNLITNTVYNVNVIATNQWGSNKSNNFSVKTIGNIPSSLTFSSITTNSFDLFWSGAQNATNFYFSLDGGVTKIDAPWFPNPWLTSVRGRANFTNLITGQTYPAVVIYDTGPDGLIESQVPYPSVTLLPGQATNITPTLINQSMITLIWTGVEGATSIQFMGVQPQSNTINQAQFSALNTGTVYTITIVPQNLNQTQSGAPQSITVKTQPANPTNLQFSAISQSSFTVNWSPAQGAEYYRYQIGSTESLTTTPQTEQLVQNLIGGTTYSFAIIAYDTGWSTNTPLILSSFSNFINVITLPTVPTPPVITNISASSITVTWTTMPNIVYTAIIGNQTISNVISPLIVTSLNGNTGYTFTIVATNPTGSVSSSTQLLTIPNDPNPSIIPNTTNATSFQFTWTTYPGIIYSYNLSNSTSADFISPPVTITSLTANTQYTLTLIARNATGPAQTQITPTTGPGSVTNIQASNILTNQFTLTWLPGLAATSYVINYNTYTTNTAAVTTTILNQNIIPQTFYTVYLISQNQFGATSSNTISVLTAPSTPDPSQTPNVATATTVQIVWTPMPNVIYSYTATNGDTGNAITSPYTKTNLAPSNNYSFTLTATNATNYASATISIYTAPNVIQLSATASTINSIALSWIGGSDGNPLTLNYNTSTITVTGLNSYNLTSLKSNTVFNIFIASQNAYGTTPSNTIAPQTKPLIPTIPTGLTQTPGQTTDTTMEITWDYDDVATLYTYSFSPNGPTGTTTGSPLNITGLAGGTTYTLTLTPSNGPLIGPPTTLSVTTAPQAIVISVASNTSNAITINLSPSQGAVTFIVYYNTSNVSIAPTNSYTIQSLQPNTPYTIYVVSQNAKGNTKSNTLNITTPHITPSQPTNLQQTGASSSGVNITWSQSQPITGYIYSFDNGGPSNVTISNPDTSLSLSNGLSQDSYYNFYLTPYNFNVSGQPNQIGVSTNPSQPSLSQIAATYNSVTVSVNDRFYYNYTYSCDTNNNIAFTGNVTVPLSRSGSFQFNVSVYNNQRGNYGSASGSFNIYTAPTILSISPNTGTTNSITINISGYNYDTSNVAYYSGDKNGTQSISGRPGTVQITGLTANTKYSTYVESINSYGNTSSNTITAWTGPLEPNPAVRYGSNQATQTSFYWTSIAGMTYSYIHSVGQSGPCTSDFWVYNLTPNTKYDFTLIATNAGNLSASTMINYWTLPSAPNLSFVSATATSVTITYTPVNGLTYKYSTGPNNNQSASPGMTAGGLIMGTSYTFYLTATNSVNTDGQTYAASAQINFTTLWTPPAKPIGVAVSNITYESMTLNWTYDSGVTTYNYTLLDSVGSGPSGTGITGTSISPTGLKYSATYTFTLTPVGPTGLVGENATLNATTLPQPPTLPLYSGGGECWDTIRFDANISPQRFIMMKMKTGSYGPTSIPFQEANAGDLYKLQYPVNGNSPSLFAALPINVPTGFNYLNFTNTRGDGKYYTISLVNENNTLNVKIHAVNSSGSVSVANFFGRFGAGQGIAYHPNSDILYFSCQYYDGARYDFITTLGIIENGVLISPPGPPLHRVIRPPQITRFCSFIVGNDGNLYIGSRFEADAGIIYKLNPAEETATVLISGLGTNYYRQIICDRNTGNLLTQNGATSISIISVNSASIIATVDLSAPAGLIRTFCVGPNGQLCYVGNNTGESIYITTDPLLSNLRA